MKFLKKSKYRPFPKGLVHGFCRNIDVFLILSKESLKNSFFHILDRKECFLDMKSQVLNQRTPENKFFDILERKKCFLDLKSEVLKKVQKWTFCKGVSSWFLSKNRRFSHMFILVNEREKERFFNILDRKECFLDLKSEVLKKVQKIDILQRG